MASPLERRPKLDVPYDLTEAEGAIWRAIVDAMPADYFSSAQVDGLKSLCQCIVMKDEVKRELEAERAKKRPRLKDVTKLRHEWQRLMDMEHKLMRSMRLWHQSVYHHRTAATRHKEGMAEAVEAGQLWDENDVLVDAAE
jgi:hypothetical protein